MLRGSSGVNKDRLWIFTELYYPEETSTGYIMTEISKGLVPYFDVNVVADAAPYDRQGRTDREDTLPLEGIRVVRLKSMRLDKNRVLQRLLKLVLLSLKFCYHFLVRTRRGDRVLLVTNPAPVLIGVSFLNKFKRARLYLIVHDVFPENAYAAKLIDKGPLYRILKHVFSKAYSRFDHLLVLGRDMKEVIAGKIAPFGSDSSIEIVENWGDTEKLTITSTSKYNPFNDGRVSVVFAGNIGRLQRLEEVVEAFGGHPENTTLTLIGSGALKSMLMSRVAGMKWENIAFLDPLPRSEQIDFINSFDISLVSLSFDMYGLGVPSKTYNILSCGRPILFVGPPQSEVDRLLSENGLGWSFSDHAGLEQFLAKLSKGDLDAFDRKTIREFAVKHYSKSSIMDRFVAILNQ